MPVRYLLDEHVSPTVARLLRGRGIDAVALREWQKGQYLSQPDEEILAAAHREGRTLVTFEVHSIPIVLRYLAESEIVHSGVVFVSARSFGQGDVARLAAALKRLAAEQDDDPLENQVLFLSPQD